MKFMLKESQKLAIDAKRRLNEGIISESVNNEPHVYVLKECHACLLRGNGR